MSTDMDIEDMEPVRGLDESDDETGEMNDVTMETKHSSSSPNAPREEKKGERKTKDRSITVSLADGKEFDISLRALKLSEVATNAFEDDADSSTYPIPGVESHVYARIHEYLLHHDGSPGKIIDYPAQSKHMHDLTDAWDAKFADSLWDEDKLLTYKVIMAANYMDIKCLLSLLCCKVGTIIQDEPWEKLSNLIIPKEYQKTK